MTVPGLMACHGPDILTALRVVERQVVALVVESSSLLKPLGVQWA